MCYVLGAIQIFEAKDVCSLVWTGLEAQVKILDLDVHSVRLACSRSSSAVRFSRTSSMTTDCAARSILRTMAFESALAELGPVLRKRNAFNSSRTGSEIEQTAGPDIVPLEESDLEGGIEGKCQSGGARDGALIICAFVLESRKGVIIINQRTYTVH